MKRVGFALTALLVVVGTCGGRVSSVDGNKQVGTLSPTDSSTLCNDSYNYFRVQISPDDLAKISCGFRGTGSATCEADYNKCVQDLRGKISTPAQPNCTNFNATLAKCGNINVGQWEQCFKEMIDIMKSATGRLPICSKDAQLNWALDVQGKISRDCLTVWIGCSASFNTGTQGGMSPPPM